jgi:hypothetical protein
MDSTGLSRREFVRSTGLAAAAVGFGGAIGIDSDPARATSANSSALSDYERYDGTSCSRLYGLELEQSGQAVALRNIPVWEFREGMAAVYCWNGCEAEGWFGRVYLQSSNPRVVTADGARHDLDLVSVVRIGKVVGKWPGLSSLCNDAGSSPQISQNEFVGMLNSIPKDSPDHVTGRSSAGNEETLLLQRTHRFLR